MTPRQITNHKRMVLAAIRRENVKQRAGRYKTEMIEPHIASKQLRVPHDVLADRDHRAKLVPLTLTAALCGDPLRGYSALDRRIPS